MDEKNEKMIVITGGAGFIGSNVLHHLNYLGYNSLVIVDDLGTSSKWQNLLNKSFLEIISKKALFEWLIGKENVIQAIFHLGACSSTVETDGNYLLENNYRYSIKLAEYALKNKIRFIYASSAATYGDGAFGFSDQVELNKLRPLNIYGFSKHLFDLWLQNQKVLDQVIGLKYFNVFGPNENHKDRMASAIFQMVPKAIKNQKIILFKSSEPKKYQDGEQKRDFIYVKEAARLTCAFLHVNERGIFNIGTGKALSWNQLAQLVFKALNLKVEIEYTLMPKDLIGKYQNYSVADMAKTSSILKEPITLLSTEEAVNDYVKNYLLTNQLC